MVIVIATLALCGSAALAYGGTVGTITWTLDNSGFLSITGTGDIPDFSTSASINAWRNYAKKIVSISIGDGITGIGNYAFATLDNLTDVTISDSVTTISEYAFSTSKKLASVTIPTSLTKIGKGAFYNCAELTNATIPASVTSIGSNVFYGCSNLKTAGPIGSGCDIEYGWQNRIPPYAFDGCNSLTSINIPSSVTSIQAYAFEGCSGLTSITIPTGVTSIAYKLFYKCSSLKNVTLPYGVTSIGTSAFEECRALTDFMIPSSVTSIGDRAFYHCTSINSIVIPAGVTGIGSAAFYECTGLSSFTIPAEVTNIGGSVFTWCSKLKTAGPIGSGCDYQFGWQDRIPDNAFSGCSGLRSVTFPVGVASIGNSAFIRCLALKNIEIPDSVTSIGSYAFSNCEALIDFTIPPSVTDIEYCTFESCKALKSINISTGVTRIGRSAFQYCNVLTDIYYDGTKAQWAGISIDSNNTPLINASKHYCPDPDFIVPQSLTVIGEEAFRGGAFVSVSLSENTEKIGAYAFADCSDLQYIYIPLGTTIIDEFAFGSLQGLTIYGRDGSTAETFANEHGYTFVNY